MRVLVVAGGTMAQAGMAALVESIDGLEVAATVGEGAAVATGRILDPDICLVDLEGADPGDGRVERLVDGLQCPVVVVCEEVSIRVALAGGARGAVSPGIPAAALGPVLEAVVAGAEVVYPPGSRRTDDPGPPGGPAGGGAGLPEPLTPRELEVLQLLPAGLTNQQVARRLGISEHTAKFHVSAVLGKLSAQSRAEAVNRGFQLGLISV